MQERDLSVLPQVGFVALPSGSLDALLISLELQRRKPKMYNNLTKLAGILFTVRVKIYQILTDVKEQMCLRHPATALPCGSGIRWSFGCMLKEMGFQILIVNASVCQLGLLFLISLSLDVIGVSFPVDGRTSLGQRGNQRSHSWHLLLG